AGFEHRASYEILEFAGDTLRRNRPTWNVYSGTEEGDVRNVDWSQYAGQIDVLHGGPPCQPFSIAGRRGGDDDTRDMFPQFIKSVESVKPRVFVAENVLGFMSQKFSDYRSSVVERLSKSYRVSIFKLSAAEFGVPQDRRRVFVVGVKKSLRQTFDPKIIEKKEGTIGVRLALGLQERAKDGLAPTLRCTLTGPRQTTSIANSTASVHKWTDLGIWPHGVSPNRSIANAFPTKNQTYRLCVEECQVLQGFPLDWAFTGAVYQRLGLIGNSVCPPVGYAVAKAIRDQVFKY
ncbi:MAG: DNA (cytosine-5-)-methyltransferase, partial [Bacteroidota bacterium]